MASKMATNYSGVANNSWHNNSAPKSAQPTQPAAAPGAANPPICVYFLSGTCRYGAQCQYRHPNTGPGAAKATRSSAPTSTTSTARATDASTMAQRSTTPGTSAARSPPGSEDIQNIKRRKLDNKFTAPGAKPNLRLNNMVPSSSTAPANTQNGPAGRASVGSAPPTTGGQSLLNGKVGSRSIEQLRAVFARCQSIWQAKPSSETTKDSELNAELKLRYSQVSSELKGLRQDINQQNLQLTELALNIYEFSCEASILAQDWVVYEQCAELVTHMHEQMPGTSKREGEFLALRFLYALCSGDTMGAILPDCELPEVEEPVNRLVYMRRLRDIRRKEDVPKEAKEFCLKIHNTLWSENYVRALKLCREPPNQLLAQICGRGVPLFRLKSLSIACTSHFYLGLERAKALTSFSTQETCLRLLKVMSVVWKTGKTDQIMDCMASIESVKKLLSHSSNRRRRSSEGNSTDKEKNTRIVWIDLEFTCIEDPDIMEFAVIITDKHLVEIDRANWVIHHNQGVCASLSDWHQRQFRRVEEGGNGLFQDVMASNLTRAQVETKAMDLISRHCPERACPIGGSSPHCDRDALKLTMPRMYKYLSHQMIDTSGLHHLCQRLSPKALKDFPKPLDQTRAHRAMTDIERSIEMLRWYIKHFLVTEVDIPEPGAPLKNK